MTGPHRHRTRPWLWPILIGALISPPLHGRVARAEDEPGTVADEPQPATDEDESQSDETAGESGEAQTDTSPTVASAKKARWFLVCALQARVNALGLTLFANGGYQIPLYRRSNLLLDGSKIEIGVTGQLSPAYVWGGPQITITPLAILVLRASIQRLYYFGTFGYLFPFEGLDADWSPERLDELWKDNLGQSAAGTFVDAAATLQAMAFNVVAQVTSRYAWFWMDFDDPYEEPYFDLLLAPEDGVWVMTSILGYLIANQVLVGVVSEHTRTREAEILRDLVGVLALWDIPPRFWAWGSPEVAVIVGNYARDPYRRGEFMFGFELSVRF